MKLQPIFSGEPNQHWGIIFYTYIFFQNPSPSDESLAGGVLRLRSHTTFQAKSEAGHAVRVGETPVGSGRDGPDGVLFEASRSG